MVGIDIFDDEINKIIGDKRMPYFYLLLAGHDLEHDENRCSFCSRKETRGWLKEIIERGVYEGKRHITRFKIMMNLRRLGFPRKKIEEKIWEFNKNCKPPENANIVRRHIKNTFKRWDRGF